MVIILHIILFFLLIFAHSDTGTVPPSRSPTPPAQDTLTLRALVSTKDAGVIIGKAGKNVADLREQTGVKAGVSKVIPGVHERVLTVTGSVEAVSKVSFTRFPFKIFMCLFSARPTILLFLSWLLPHPLLPSPHPLHPHIHQSVFSSPTTSWAPLLVEVALKLRPFKMALVRV